MSNTPKNPTPGEQVQSLLERMEMTRRDLARESKLSLASIENALAADAQPSSRTQIAIELALNTPLWSSPEQFEQTKKVQALLGFVPEIESIKRLKACARRYKVKGYGSVFSKPELTAMILRELDVRAGRMQKVLAQIEAARNAKADAA